MWKILRHQRALASDTCQCPVIHFIFKHPTLNSFSQLVPLYHMIFSIFFMILSNFLRIFPIFLSGPPTKKSWIHPCLRLTFLYGHGRALILRGTSPRLEIGTDTPNHCIRKKKYGVNPSNVCELKLIFLKN